MLETPTHLWRNDMSFDKKTIVGVAGVLVFTLVLGISSALAGNSNLYENTEYSLFSSAGANAAIGVSNTNAAGATGAVDGSVGVVGTNSNIVGQGNYNTFGYTNLGMAVVEGNLNVRKTASMDGSIVGKLTNYAACEIIGEENGFYQIVSGSVEGYVSADYIITGEEALVIAQSEARNMALVTTDVLRVREEPSTDSATLSTVNNGEELVVTETLDGWVKVEVDNFEGYVSAEYVTVEMKLKTGNTLSELAYGSGISDVRVELVNYALQFVGNRYVWGGTSLSNGVDCSGFTMKIYEKFGVYLPHHSGSQSGYGKKISSSELQPGDLIFYGDGSSINHVAIYIGNGQIVHASNARDGIKISNAFYRTPVCCVSYLN